MQSYDYRHRAGVHEIGWGAFAQLAARLAEALAAHQPQAVVGIGRAGLFPATAVACALRIELLPVRVSRRVNDVVVHAAPQWRVPVSPLVAGRVVAVVDEIADTGRTLAMVAARALQQGATRVVTASLVRHSWASPVPDACALETDAFVVFPWDRQVLEGDRWKPHPEIVEALKLQGIALDLTKEAKP